MNDKSNQGANQSANMYSYNQAEQNSKIIETGAIRRSLGEINPNAIPYNQNQNNSYQNDRPINQSSIVINIDQSPPLYWMFFLIVGIIQIVFIIFLANYYDWDKLNKPSNTSNSAKEEIQKKYRTFQDLNIMIFLGFGFLRAFLKHHQWSSIAFTLIGGVLSFEFGLFTLICWASIIRKSWYPGFFNFQHLLDANFCAASTVISLGTLFGKLSLAQYFVMFISETIFSTLNYVLLRQQLEIIDVGGALTVHLFGAIFGGIFSFVSFVPQQERDRIAQSPHLGMNYNSNIFGLFGTLILVSYWPSFNTVLLDKDQRYRGIINTYLSIGGSIIGTFLISPIYNRSKLNVQDILNSTFAGGIIVSGCCNIINEFWSSIIFGILAGGLSSYLYFLLNKRLVIKGYHDTSGVLYYHGIPAFLGGIVSTIFVGNLANWKLDDRREMKNFIGNILDYNNFNFDMSYSKRAGIQLAAILITILIAAASGLVAGFSIKFCNCHIAYRYFNDSEHFDVSDNEPFPWEDEQVQIRMSYNARKDINQIQ